jgi:GT2 family glycosyltransferase
LIHEEIVARHRRMPERVNFLSTFNVLYRRAVLEQVGGFDECRFNGPGVAGDEDTELAFRLVERGYDLRFEPGSRVAHFHLTSYRRYLRVQQRHGFYRMRLYADYPRRAHGDSYSSLVDHVQPPVAMLLLASLPLVFWPTLALLPALLALLLWALQFPMALRLMHSQRSWRYLAYIPFGFGRAFARGFGATAGALDVALQGVLRRKSVPPRLSAITR